MIAGFADEATRVLHETGRHGSLRKGTVKAALRKLDQLNNARKPDDMRHPPGNKLHPLTGRREGQWAVWVNDQYRLCFRFEGENAVDVEITDYHDR